MGFDKFRRRFIIRMLSSIQGLLLLGGIFFFSLYSFAASKDPEIIIHKVAQTGQATKEERIHIPILDVPRVAENGSLIPVSVKIDHPMEPGHYIKSIEIKDDRSPVPSKGVLSLSPQNGQAFLATRIKLPAGTTTVRAIVECNLHGFWEGDADTQVALGGCGTQGMGENAKHPDEGLVKENQKPEIRVSREVQKGKAVQVRVKLKHPMIREGLEYPENSGKFIPAHYINNMEVFYGEKKVMEYKISPGLSENPFITFYITAFQSGRLKVVFQCNLGNRFENTIDLSVI